MKNTVIFDLDGTLLNTLDDLAAAVDFALGKLGFKGLDRSVVRKFVGNGIRKLTDRALAFSASNGKTSELREENAKSEKCYELCLEYYKAHGAEKTRLYDGVSELLTELKSAGIKTAVVTNKVDEAVKELRGLFFPSIDFAVGISEAIRPKPSCDGVNAALAALRADPRDAVYVGDGETDIATAKNAGLPVVAVSWGFRDKAFLQTLEPDYIIDAPSELPAILRAIE